MPDYGEQNRAYSKRKTPVRWMAAEETYPVFERKQARHARPLDSWRRFLLTGSVCSNGASSRDVAAAPGGRFAFARSCPFSLALYQLCEQRHYTFNVGAACKGVEMEQCKWCSAPNRRQPAHYSWAPDRNQTAPQRCVRAAEGEGLGSKPALCPRMIGCCFAGCSESRGAHRRTLTSLWSTGCTRQRTADAFSGPAPLPHHPQFPTRP